MTDDEDFARSLRELADAAVPGERQDGRTALAAIKRRRRRAAGTTGVSLALVGLVTLGAATFLAPDRPDEIAPANPTDSEPAPATELLAPGITAMADGARFYELDDGTVVIDTELEAWEPDERFFVTLVVTTVNPEDPTEVLDPPASVTSVYAGDHEDLELLLSGHEPGPAAWRGRGELVVISSPDGAARLVLAPSSGLGTTPSLVTWDPFSALDGSTVTSVVLRPVERYVGSMAGREPGTGDSGLLRVLAATVRGVHGPAPRVGGLVAGTVEQGTRAPCLPAWCQVVWDGERPAVSGEDVDPRPADARRVAEELEAVSSRVIAGAAYDLCVATRTELDREAGVTRTAQDRETQCLLDRSYARLLEMRAQHGQEG